MIMQDAGGKIIKIPRLFLLLAIFTFLVAPPVEAGGTGSDKPVPRTIRVAMDNNYPPYVFLDGRGILQGILVDQWLLWQKQTGIQVEIKAMDWGSALKGMKTGD